MLQTALAPHTCGNCSRCEQFPKKITESGTLYLWSPLNHSAGKIIAALHQSGNSYKWHDREQCLAICVTKDEILSITQQVTSLLTMEEHKDIQALFCEGTELPTFSDFSRMMSFRELSTRAESQWLIDMMADQRVTSYFQPIVSASDTSQIFAHEALLRGYADDGSIVGPGKIIDMARDADLLFQLDLLARRTAIQTAHRMRVPAKVFINFNPTAIYDPVFCLRSTMAIVDATDFDRSDIVFEAIESDRHTNPGHLKNVLEFYRNAGFSIALDDVGSGYSSLNLIHQIRPDFIKLDMEMIRDIDKDPFKALITEKLLDIAQAMGIRTVSEGVETLEELTWLQNHGADLIQGYLVAKPAPDPTRFTPKITS